MATAAANTLLYLLLAEAAASLDPPVTGHGIRVDLHSATGTKLDFPPLLNVMEWTHEPRLDEISSFSFSIPADDDAAGNIALGHEAWLYHDSEGLLYKGKIEAKETAYADGAQVLKVAGSSIARELVWLNTLLGLTFDGDTLDDSADTLLADSPFTRGDTLSTSDTYVRRMDGLSRWQGLTDLANYYGCHVREDLIDDEIDIDDFGDDSGLRFQTFEQVPIELAATVFPITSLKLLAESRDLWNTVIPIGEREGVGGRQLTLSELLAPPVADVTETAFAIAATSYAVQMPATVGAGDLLVMAIAVANGGSQTINTPSGWTSEGTASPAGNQIRVSIFSKDAAGTEDGTTVAVTISGATPHLAYAQVYRVAAADWNGTLSNVEATLLADPGSGAPNSPSHTPTWGDSETTLFIAGFGARQDGDLGEDSVSTTAPTGYRDLIGGASDSSSADAAALTTAARVITTSGAEDPEPAWEDPDANQWVAFTIAIRLAGLVGGTTPVINATGPDGNDYQYIEDATSVAAYGARTKILQMKSVTPIELSESGFFAAAQALYNLATTWLTRHKDPLLAYEVKVVGLTEVSSGSRVFELGQKVHVVGKALVDHGNGARAWLDVDEDLWIMGYRRTFRSDGTDDLTLQVSTVDRQLPRPGDAMADMMESVFALEAAPEIRWHFGENYLDEEGITLLGPGDSAAFLRWRNKVLPLLTVDSAGAMVGDQVVWHLNVEADADGATPGFSFLNIGANAANPGGNTLNLGSLWNNIGSRLSLFATSTHGVVTLRGFASADDLNIALFSVAGSFGGGTGAVFIGNAQAIPTTNPTNGIIVYVEGGALKARGSGGTVTTIANA
jgi:hypothetical protein